MELLENSKIGDVIAYIVPAKIRKVYSYSVNVE